LRQIYNKIDINANKQPTPLWTICCLILHNMIVCFEERHQMVIAGTMEWAIAEGRELDDNNNMGAYVDPPQGTPGQKFHVCFTEKLFHERGLCF
ncbi:hypothetical protein PAXRUDRAFT_173178, partial [Paxillus rubicundulus Ve08.2h10]